MDCSGHWACAGGVVPERARIATLFGWQALCIAYLERDTRYNTAIYCCDLYHILLGHCLVNIFESRSIHVLVTMTEALYTILVILLLHVRLFLWGVQFRHQRRTQTRRGGLRDLKPHCVNYFQHKNYSQVLYKARKVTSMSFLSLYRCFWWIKVYVLHTNVLFCLKLRLATGLCSDH